jgi:transcriptional regulator with XRE-family HTH domain
MINWLRLGSKIQDMRRLKQITQQQLAERSKISDVYLGYIEQGIRRCSIETYIRLVNALGFTLDDLFADCFQDEASFKEAYKAKRGQMFRVRGISWWDEEMPSLEEMERGRQTLQAFAEKQGTIDLVFTHDAPASDKLYMGYSEIDELSRFLESLKDVMHYGKWFYGHLHDNRRVFENHYLLYEQIVQIG